MRVITRAIYRVNGAGYDDSGPSGPRLDVAAAGVRRHQPPEPRPAHLGRVRGGRRRSGRRTARCLYFGSQHDREPYYAQPHVDLYVHAGRAGGEVRKVFGFDGAIVRGSRSPPTAGGSASPATADVQAGALLRPARPLRRRARAGSARARNLTASYDGDVSRGWAPTSTRPAAAVRRRSSGAGTAAPLIAVAAERGRANLERFDAGDRRQSLPSPTATRRSSPTRPPPTARASPW